MERILRDNALEAWSSAIECCENITQGKATLKYRKNFVSSLHNAVELFLKQYMLDINDHRVCKISKKMDPDGILKTQYESASDITQFFINLSVENAAKIHSVEYRQLSKYSRDFFELYYNKHNGSKAIVDKALTLLGKLRNDETYFYVNKWDFLTDTEFEQLYNFMIVFYKIIQEYNLLPYWGKPFEEYTKLGFDRVELRCFSYRKAVEASETIKKLRETFKSQSPIPHVEVAAFEITDAIVTFIDGKWKKKFDELWVYIEMALHFDILEIHEEIEEYDDSEYGIGVNRYCYLDIV